MLDRKKEKEPKMMINLRKDSGYRAISSTILQLEEKETFYFVLRDCSMSLLKEGFGRRTKIELELDVRNNEMHTSAHEEHYDWVLPFLIVGYLILLFVLGRE